MPDRLSIINDALAATGNIICATPDDGSDEWIVGERGLDRTIPLLLARHPWNFATITSELARLGESEELGFEHVYARPAACLHIRALYFAGTPVTDYRIVNGRIHARLNPGFALYVREPGPDDWNPIFAEAVRRYVEAQLLRGLNEDYGEANRREASAEAMLAEAKATTDQEEHGRAFFRSRSLERRRGGSGRRAR